MRLAGGLLACALFFAAMFYVTTVETSVECTVCMRFGGSENCATVSGPDTQQAVMQATTTACAPISSGVTEGMKCNRTPPLKVDCSA